MALAPHMAASHVSLQIMKALNSNLGFCEVYLIALKLCEEGLIAICKQVGVVLSLHKQALGSLIGMISLPVLSLTNIGCFTDLKQAIYPVLCCLAILKERIVKPYLRHSRSAQICFSQHDIQWTCPWP